MRPSLLVLLVLVGCGPSLHDDEASVGSAVSGLVFPYDQAPDAFRVVNIAGDCNGLRARFFHPATGRFFVFSDPNPCAVPDYAEPNSVYEGAIVHALATRGLSEVVPGSGVDVQFLDTVGDCYIARAVYMDGYVGNYLTYVLRDWCASVDPHGLGSAVNKYLSAGVEPLLASDAVLTGFPSCQYHADQSNYQSVLASIPLHSDKFRTLCFAGGTYTGRLIVNGYERLILRPVWGTRAKFITDNWGPPSEILGVGAVFYSSNIVVSGMDFENTHFISDPAAYLPDSTASQAFSGGYTPGLLLKDLTFTSPGKQTLSIGGCDASRVEGGSINGLYMLVQAGGGSMVLRGVSLHQRDTSGWFPGETHSLVLSYNSRAIYENVTVQQDVGNAFLSGSSNFEPGPMLPPTYVKNIWGHVKYWIDQHPNFYGLQLVLQGVYDSSTVDYYPNLVNGGGVGANTALYKQ